MNLSNFIDAAKKIANSEERFCCHALNQDSIEYEIFNDLFNPHDEKALKEKTDKGEEGYAYAQYLSPQ